MLINPFKSKRSWPLLLVLISIFMVFYFLVGVVYANDSHSYFNDSVRVGPLYPLIIQIFDFVFPSDIYVNILVFFQELLAAYAIFSLMTFIRDRFSVRTTFWYLLSIGFAGTYFLRYLLVGETALYSNTILSEAITYPLYFIFVKYAFAAWDQNDTRYFTTAFILALILACARGQLIFLILVLVILFFALLSHKNHQEKRAFWVRMLICITCYILGIIFIPLGYNYFRSGNFSQPTIGNEVVLGAVLYNSDLDDANLFPAGSEEYEIIYETLSLCEDAQLTYKSAPRGFFNSFIHYQASHDPVRSELMKVITNHYKNKLIDINSKPIMLVKLSTDILPVLLKNNFIQYIHTSMINCFAGLVRSNSIFNIPGIYWSIFVYSIGAIGFALSAKSCELQSERRLILTVYICTLTNAVFCSFGVHELSRYVYYNFGLIYLSLMLVLLGLMKSYRKSGAL